MSVPSFAGRPAARGRAGGGPALAGLLFLFLLGVYLTTAGGKGYSVDGAFGYEMAKTISLDPQHTYFRRFKTAFARWGALMPLLGQPFVLAGNALAGLAPERDDLFVAGHRFRVEEWPVLEPAGRSSYRPPPPQTDGQPALAIALVSALANGLEVGQAGGGGGERPRLGRWEGSDSPGARRDGDGGVGAGPPGRRRPGTARSPAPGRALDWAAAGEPLLRLSRPP